MFIDVYTTFSLATVRVATRAPKTPTIREYGLVSQGLKGSTGCGRADRHPYELFLQLEGIEHRTIRDTA